MACARLSTILVLLLVLSSLSSFPDRLYGQGNKAGGQKPSKLRRVTPGGDTALSRIWLEQDVAWIITDEERTAWGMLKNDEQRDEFIEALWARRDPTPDTFENEYEEEHYRRMEYANAHFSNTVPGWKSDRGRIYVLYGPPDRKDLAEQDSQPTALVPASNSSASYPTETWRYRYLEGVGQDVVIEFVDVCTCGDYRMRMPSELKDALLYVPTAVFGIKKADAPDLKLFLALPVEPQIR
jgi:GWxTD domain-containing protein